MEPRSHNVEASLAVNEPQSLGGARSGLADYMQSVALALAFLCLSGACQQTLPHPQDPVSTGTEVELARAQLEHPIQLNFDWEREGPFEFLEALVASYESTCRFHDAEETPTAKRLWLVTVRGVRKGWVQEEDLPRLLVQLDDDRPCMGVVMQRSSFLHFGVASNVGNEARFLIEAFRNEEGNLPYPGYPPALCSVSPRAPAPTARELRDWWQARLESLAIP